MPGVQMHVHNMLVPPQMGIWSTTAPHRKALKGGGQGKSPQQVEFEAKHLLVHFSQKEIWPEIPSIQAISLAIKELEGVQLENVVRQFWEETCG